MICNNNKDGDAAKAAVDKTYTDMITGPDGTKVSASYPGTSFTCLTGARTLVASATALIAAAAAMM